jgi:hypothetical protein
MTKTLNYILVVSMTMVLIGTTMVYNHLSLPVSLFFVGFGLIGLVFYFIRNYFFVKIKPGFELIYLVIGTVLLLMSVKLSRNSSTSLFGPVLLVKAYIVNSLFVFIMMRKTQGKSAFPFDFKSIDNL